MMDPNNPFSILEEKDRKDQERHEELKGLLEQIRDALRLVVLALKGEGS